MMCLLLCSLSDEPTEIPERFSSSSLPPSFARGRCTATFFHGAADLAAPLFLAG
jgi:hypothetical protein